MVDEDTALVGRWFRNGQGRCYTWFQIQVMPAGESKEKFKHLQRQKKKEKKEVLEKKNSGESNPGHDGESVGS